MSISLKRNRRNFEKQEVAKLTYSRAVQLLGGIKQSTDANDVRILQVISLLETALANGSGDAGYRLASFYRTGSHVKQNEAMARDLVRKAAKASMPSAAALRVEGVWCLKDNKIDMAESLLKQAAVLGSRDAVADLAMMDRSRSSGNGSIAALTTLITYEGAETPRSLSMLESLKEELPDGYQSKLH